MIPEKMMTVDDVAHFLGVSRQTLNRWHRTGQGPKRIKLGKKKKSRVRYLYSDVKDWLNV